MNDTRAFKPFSQIIGQERALGFLKGVIAKERIPHAYLFTGIPGIGKTTTAFALTQVMNCTGMENVEACGRCRSCRQVAHGTFTDLVFIEPDGRNIKIEQIRDLNRALSFKPVSGKYRISVIRQAEMMTPEAANSFLKTLEEPPPGNILILNVIEPLDLLPTIVSRCQKIPFRPLSARVIAEWLVANKAMDEDKAMVLAKVSDGSLGRSIALSDSAFIEERGSHIQNLIKLQGLLPGQVLKMALEYADMEKKRRRVKSEKKGIGLFELLSIWKSWYRDLSLMKVEGSGDLLINIDYSEKLRNISKNLKLEDIIDSLLVVDRAQRDLGENRNLDLLMENTVLSLRALIRTK